MTKKTDKVTISEALRTQLRACKLMQKESPGLFASTVLFYAVSALNPFVTVVFSARIINELAGKREPSVLLRLVAAAVLIAALLALLKAALEHWYEYHWAAVWHTNEKLYSDKFLGMDFSVLDRQATHDLYSQIMQAQNWSGWGILQAVRFTRFLTQHTASILGAVALTVTLFLQKVPEGGGTLTALNHPGFILLLLLLLLLAAVVSSRLANRAERYWLKHTEEAKLGNRFGLYTALTVMEPERGADMRMYDQQEICEHYSRRNHSFTVDSAIARDMAGPGGLFTALSSAVSVLSIGCIYVFVCLKAYGGAFGVGSVTQYVAAVTVMSQGFSGLMETLGDMKNNAPFLRSCFALLDTPNEMYQGSLTTEKRSDRNYEVEFRDVSFRYPNTDVWALRHVSMKFKVGSRLAVVGRNGSGKTTFIKLLCRLYDPTEGEILLNGIDIRKYNYGDYLSIFSVVFQDFKLLSCPLGQNVAASRDYDRERVMDALCKAGFETRADTFPKGIDTCLYREFADDGVEISGGEAQKIAIARALYKDAPFIILDEPTAALDPVAEAEIYARFNEIVGDKTAIYISHRLSSCKFCDEIAVFDHGSIVQQGSHDSLLDDERGTYYQLWYAQAQYYTK